LLKIYVLEPHDPAIECLVFGLVSRRTVLNVGLEWSISGRMSGLYTYTTYYSGLIIAVCPVS
jgi:hypothetical protein